MIELTTELRPHQDRAIAMLRQSWKGHRTHILQAPTGAGKTVIAAHIIKGFVNRGMRVLFIVPLTVLIEQTAESFYKQGLPKAGIIWRQHPDLDYSKLIQIASIDTLENRTMPEYDCIIYDEAHSRRRWFLEHIEESEKPIIGLSATPMAAWMGNYYTNFVKVATTRELIDQGFLTDFEIYAPHTPDLSEVKSRKSAEYGVDYVEAQVAEVMQGHDLVADIVSTWLQLGENEPTIAFCVNVAHANQVANEFESAGVNAEVITAKTLMDERQRIFKRFTMGVTKVICNVATLVAGLDLDVRCIIYARPTKSEIRYIQCIGRGLRTAEGKERCLILDHSGTVHRLGYPDSIEYDSLLSESDGMDKAERIEKEIEKLEKLPKECPGCHFMKPAGMHECSKCGFVPRSGQDVETDRTRELVALKKKVEQKITGEDKQKFYSELRGYWEEKRRDGKQWSEGWIAHKFRQKYDHWPSKNMVKISLDPSKETKNYIISQNIRNAKRKPVDTAAAKVHLDSIRESLG
jgi:superfamily II DNA or RNA helicase